MDGITIKIARVGGVTRSRQIRDVGAASAQPSVSRARRAVRLAAPSAPLANSASPATSPPVRFKTRCDSLGRSFVARVES